MTYFFRVPHKIPNCETPIDKKKGPVFGWPYSIIEKSTIYLASFFLISLKKVLAPALMSPTSEMNLAMTSF